MTQPFHFPDGRAANNAEDLLELCKQYPDDATGFLVRQDLEKWLAYIGNYDVAECAANARQIDTGDRQKLEDFLNKCHSLNEPEPAPAAAIEPDLKDYKTPPESAAPVTEMPPKWTESAAKNSEQVSESTAPKSPSPDKATASSSTPSTIAAPADTKPKSKTQADSQPSSATEKPSFFQVVAKLIVKILYRDKA